MTRVLVGGLLAVSVVAGARVTSAAIDAPTLTEIQQLKAQLQQAQEQLLQAQYQLATCQAQATAAKLSQSRRTLEQDWAAPGYVFDWSTLTFTPQAPPERRP